MAKNDTLASAADAYLSDQLSAKVHVCMESSFKTNSLPILTPTVIYCRHTKNRPATMLESLLKKTPKNDNVVALLRTRLVSEANAAAEAQRAYDELSLQAADGGADPKAADKAHDTYLAAVQRQQRTERTLQAAIEREAEQAKTDARAALAAEFVKAQAAAERRAKAATATEAALAATVKAIHDQRQATADLQAALPSALTHTLRDGLWIEADDIQFSTKKELERLRLWHPAEPMHAAGPFALKYQQAVSLLRDRAAIVMSKQL